jgi:hypothetical protein
MHVCMCGQPWHVMTAPQPSSIMPHLAPTASHVFGRQPQWLGEPAPPHVRGAVQVPQSIVWPHPSDVVPQV